MDLKKSKTLIFLRKNYSYFAAAAIIIIFFAVSQALFDIFPFGSAVMASYDQLAQVCPYLEHYFSVLDGTSGLFHTFYVGRGMDVFGILAFSSVSPFTFLFLVAGRYGSLKMVSFVLPLKAVCSAITSAWLIKKRFKNVPEYVVSAFGVLYALGGYFYVSNTYMNWVDLMIYMPILVDGFIKFAEGKGIKTLAVSLALCIYTCFSITCFSFFLIFPICILYILICVKSGEKTKKAAELAMAFALAIATALPLLVPSLYAYLKAGRNTGMFDKVFDVKIIDYEHLYRKFTYILVDGAFIFLSIKHFARGLKKDKTTLFLFVAVCVSLFPCVIDESMLLLNFGSYNSYALRFGFLTGILFFVTAARETNEIFKAPRESVKSVKTGIFTAICILLSGVAALSLARLFNYILNGKFEENKAFASYFPAFAHSEGGLEGTAILFGITVVVFTAVTLLFKFRLINIRGGAAVACVVAIACSSFNVAALVKGDRQGGSYENIKRYAEINSEITERYGDKYARIKSYDYYVSANSPIMARYYACGLFSSMADEKNLYLPALFKYRGNGTNSSRSNGGGVLSDALLGYDYVVYKKADKSNAISSVLTETDITVGPYTVYRNTLAFPVAALITGETGEDGDLNPVEKIEKIYEYLSGGERGLEELPLKFTEDEGNVKVTYTIPANSEYWQYNDFPSEMRVKFLNSKNPIPEYGAYQYLESGGTRSVTLTSELSALSAKDVEAHFHVAAITRSKIELLRDKLKAKAVNYDLGRNEIIIPDKIIAERGEKLYLGFADIEGYKITVNGKDVKPEENFADFIVIPLVEGENEVKIKYVSPYFKYIAAGLIFGFVSAAAIIVLRRKENIYSKLEKAIGVAAYAVAAGAALFFAAFPLGIYIVKIIGLL